MSEQAAAEGAAAAAWEHHQAAPLHPAIIAVCSCLALQGASSPAGGAAKACCRCGPFTPAPCPTLCIVVQACMLPVHVLVPLIGRSMPSVTQGMGKAPALLAAVPAAQRHVSTDRTAYAPKLSVLDRRNQPSACSRALPLRSTSPAVGLTACAALQAELAMRQPSLTAARRPAAAAAAAPLLPPRPPPRRRAAAVHCSQDARQQEQQQQKQQRQEGGLAQLCARAAVLAAMGTAVSATLPAAARAEGWRPRRHMEGLRERKFVSQETPKQVGRAAGAMQATGNLTIAERRLRHHAGCRQPAASVSARTQPHCFPS